MEEMQGYCVIISNYRKNWPRLGIRDPEASRVLHLPASGAASPKAPKGYCSHVEKGRICLCKKSEWNIPGAVIICTATSDISCTPFICMSIMVSVIVVTE